MLKIYLDWNIITHLKKNDKDNTSIRTVLARLCPYFVFPFSKAHLHDLGFGDKECPGYSKDMHNLSVICGTHLLKYNKETNNPYPYQCTPEGYIENNEDEIEIFLSGFSKDKFSHLLSKANLSYPLIKKIFTHIRIQPIKLPYLNKEVTNLADLMETILDNLNKILIDDSICGRIEKYINEQYHEEYVKIKRSNYNNVFHNLDDIFIKQGGKTLDDFLNIFLSDNNSLNYFISLYLTLNLIGYKSDKRKTLLNIITDAIHAYYASRCDVFVTNDRALKEKAKAVYYKMGIRTRIIEKKAMIKFMEDEVSAEYDLDNLIKNILPTFEVQQLGKTDALHFKELPFRFWGFFNFCAVALSDIPKRRNVIFRLGLLPDDYVYYTELSAFFDIVKTILTKEELLQFDMKYINVFNSRRKEAILKTHYLIERKDYTIHLMADPESIIPLPMMVFSGDV